MAVREWVPRPRPYGDARVGGTKEDSTLEAVYDRLIRDIYAYVYAKVGNRQEAEDLTSQVFVKAVQGLDLSRGFESARAWIFQAARTTVADHWRNVYQARVDSLDRLLTAGWAGPAEASAPEHDPSLEERVQALLAKLPQRYRDVLTYRFLLGYSVRETAQRMGLSEANAKVLQLRALRRAADLEQGSHNTG